MQQFKIDKATWEALSPEQQKILSDDEASKKIKINWVADQPKQKIDISKNRTDAEGVMQRAYNAGVDFINDLGSNAQDTINTIVTPLNSAINIALPQDMQIPEKVDFMGDKYNYYNGAKKLDRYEGQMLANQVANGDTGLDFSLNQYAAINSLSNPSNNLLTTPTSQDLDTYEFNLRNLIVGDYGFDDLQKDDAGKYFAVKDGKELELNQSILKEIAGSIWGDKAEIAGAIGLGLPAKGVQVAAGFVPKMLDLGARSLKGGAGAAVGNLLDQGRNVQAYDEYLTPEQRIQEMSKAGALESIANPIAELAIDGMVGAYNAVKKGQNPLSSIVASAETKGQQYIDDVIKPDTQRLAEVENIAKNFGGVSSSEQNQYGQKLTGIAGADSGEAMKTLSDIYDNNVGARKTYLQDAMQLTQNTQKLWNIENMSDPEAVFKSIQNTTQTLKDAYENIYGQTKADIIEITGDDIVISRPDTLDVLKNEVGKLRPTNVAGEQLSGIEINEFNKDYATMMDILKNKLSKEEILPDGKIIKVDADGYTMSGMMDLQRTFNDFFYKHLDKFTVAQKESLTKIKDSIYNDVENYLDKTMINDTIRSEMKSKWQGVNQDYSEWTKTLGRFTEIDKILKSDTNINEFTKKLINTNGDIDELGLGLLANISKHTSKVAPEKLDELYKSVLANITEASKVNRLGDNELLPMVDFSKFNQNYEKLQKSGQLEKIFGNSKKGEQYLQSLNDFHKLAQNEAELQRGIIDRQSFMSEFTQSQKDMTRDFLYSATYAVKHRLINAVIDNFSKSAGYNTIIHRMSQHRRYAPLDSTKMLADIEDAIYTAPANKISKEEKANWKELRNQVKTVETYLRKVIAEVQNQADAEGAKAVYQREFENLNQNLLPYFDQKLLPNKNVIYSGVPDGTATMLGNKIQAEIDRQTGNKIAEQKIIKEGINNTESPNLVKQQIEQTPTPETASKDSNNLTSEAIESKMTDFAQNNDVNIPKHLNNELSNKQLEQINSIKNSIDSQLDWAIKDKRDDVIDILNSRTKLLESEVFLKNIKALNDGVDIMFTIKGNQKGTRGKLIELPNGFDGVAVVTKDGGTIYEHRSGARIEGWYKDEYVQAVMRAMEKISKKPKEQLMKNIEDIGVVNETLKKAKNLNTTRTIDEPKKGEIEFTIRDFDNNLKKGFGKPIKIGQNNHDAFLRYDTEKKSWELFDANSGYRLSGAEKTIAELMEKTNKIFEHHGAEKMSKVFDDANFRAMKADNLELAREKYNSLNTNEKTIFWQNTLDNAKYAPEFAQKSFAEVSDVVVEKFIKNNKSFESLTKSNNDLNLQSIEQKNNIIAKELGENNAKTINEGIIDEAKSIEGETRYRRDDQFDTSRGMADGTKRDGGQGQGEDNRRFEQDVQRMESDTLSDSRHDRGNDSEQPKKLEGEQADRINDGVVGRQNSSDKLVSREIDNADMVSNGNLQKHDTNNEHNSQVSTRYSNTTNTDLRQKPSIELTRGQRENINAKVKEIIKKDVSQITPDDKEVLRQYTGVGGLDNSTNAKGLFNQHYTPYDTVRAIYDAIDNAGFEIKKALEPASGSGNFVGMRPEYSWDMVDIDEINAKVTERLYPEAKVTNDTYELFDGKNYDLIISNVPFASYDALPRAYAVGKNSIHPDFKAIHNFYFAHSIDKAKDNGLVAFITSTGTMDGKTESKALREYLVARADVIGAFRLPSKTFSKNAHTDTMADVIFLQKRPQGATPTTEQFNKNRSFTEVVEVDGYPMNKYFADNTHKMLGDVVIGADKTKMGKEGWLVQGEPRYSDMIIEKQNYDDVKITGHNATTQINKQLPMQSTNKEADTSQITMLRQLQSLRDSAQNEMVDVSEQASKILERYKEAGYKHPFSTKELSVQAKKEFGMLFDRDFNLAESFKNTVRYKDSGKINANMNDSFEKRALSLEDFDGILDMTTGLISREEVFASGKYAMNKDGAFINNKLYYAGDIWSKIDEIANLDDPLYKKQVEELKKILPEQTPKDRVNFSGNEEWLPQNVKEALGVTQTDGKFTVNERAYFLTNSQREIFEKKLNKMKLVTKHEDQTMEEHLVDLKKVNQEWEEIILPQLRKHLETEKLMDLVTDTYNKNFSTFVFPKFDGSTLTALPTGFFRGEQFKLQSHQSEGAERIVYNRGGVIAFAPGGGKTITAIVSERNLKAIGSLKKPLYAVPANTIKQWRETYRQLYPDAKLLEYPTYKAGANKGKEKAWSALSAEEKELLLYDIKNTNYDAVFMSYEMLKDIPLPKETMDRYIDELVSDINQSYNEFLEKEKVANNTLRSLGTMNKKDAKELAKMQERIAIFKKRIEETIDYSKAVTLEDLGFDAIVVDEIQNFRNIGFAGDVAKGGLGDGVTFTEKKSKIETGQMILDKNGNQVPEVKEQIVDVSLNSWGSYDMRFKTQFISEKNNGRNVILLSGTPTPKKPMELYTLLRHMGDGVIKKLKLKDAKDFANTFFETSTQEGTKTDGSATAINVVSKVKNTDALYGMIGRFIDYRTHEMMSELPRPKAVFEEHLILQNDAQRLVTEDLLHRARFVKDDMMAVRAKELDSKDAESAGELFFQGKNAAEDIRFYTPKKRSKFLGNYELTKAINEKIKDPKYSKIAKTVEMAALQRVAKEDSGQIIFINRQNLKLIDGTEINIHQEIKQDLIDTGKFKADEIGVANGSLVTNPTTGKETQKSLVGLQNLVDAYNEGKIKVIIGTTDSLGVGVDLNKYTTDIYNIDYEWNPGDMEQRLNRGVRQGNINSEVKVHTFYQAGSYDDLIKSVLNKKIGFNNVFWEGYGKGKGSVEIPVFQTPDVFDQMIALETDPIKKKGYEIDRDFTRGNKEYKSILENINDIDKQIGHKKYTIDIAKNTINDYTKKIENSLYHPKYEGIKDEEEKAKKLKNWLFDQEERKAMWQSKIESYQEEIKILEDKQSGMKLKSSDMNKQLSLMKEKFFKEVGRGKVSVDIDKVKNVFGDGVDLPKIKSSTLAGIGSVGLAGATLNDANTNEDFRKSIISDFGVKFSQKVNVVNADAVPKKFSSHKGLFDSGTGKITLINENISNAKADILETIADYSIKQNQKAFDKVANDFQTMKSKNDDMKDAKTIEDFVVKYPNSNMSLFWLGLLKTSMNKNLKLSNANIRLTNDDLIDIANTWSKR